MISRADVEFVFVVEMSLGSVRVAPDLSCLLLIEVLFLEGELLLGVCSPEPRSFF